MRPLLPVLALCVACSSPERFDEPLRPSLTMIRIGEAIPEDPPVVPDDHYLPGIQIKSEDYETDRRRGDWAPPPFTGEPTDLSFMVDVEDPAPLEKHQAYDYASGVGGLFDGAADEDILEFDDVEQGAIGDCYLVAALSSALHGDSDGSIRDGLIRARTDADGHVTGYVVRFYDAWGVPQDVPVDADLVRKNGRPTYARSIDTDRSGEEWGISLVEKAYAQWHGGYGEVGDGGWAGDVLQAITGSTATYRPVARLSDRTVIASIEEAIADNRPVVAGTFGEEDGVDYSGTKIYAWHAYSVLGVKRATADGEEDRITLRNPWGEVEPPGNGPDDGIFDLPLSDFRRLYQGLTFGGSASADNRAPAAVSDLELVGAVDGKASLTFTATGDDGTRGLAARYDVRISDVPLDDASFYSATSVTVGSPQSPGLAESVEVVLPDASTTWYVAVRVEDEAGNISPLSNVLTVQADDAPIDGVLPTLFDFESGTDAWATTGPFHLTELDAASGTHSFWLGLEDQLDYDTGARVEGSLTSPVLDLRDSSTVVVMWEQLLDVEGGSARDKAVLEVATQGGRFEDWTPAWEKDGLTDDFTLASVDLDAYAGQQVQLRFRFDSVDAERNSGLGWFVDDVWVWAD